MEALSVRLNKAMELRGIRQADLVALTGIPKSAISQYCSGSFKPKQERIYLLATALRVDEAWLMGLDVPMERECTEEPAAPEGDGRIRAKVEQLTPENLAAFEQILEILAENPELIQPTLGILEIKSKTSP